MQRVIGWVGAIALRLFAPVGWVLLRARPFAPSFFESDVYARSTAVYVWMANQFGHFALGLVLSGLVGQALIWLVGAAPATAIGSGGVLVLVLYLGKEAADVAIETEDQSLPFRLQRDELTWDSLDDTAFVAAGVAAAGLVAAWVNCMPMGFWVWLLAALLAFGGARGAMTWGCRRRLDGAALPSFARLRRFNGALELLHAATPAPPGRAVRRAADQATAAAADAIDAAVHLPSCTIVIAAARGQAGRTFLGTAIAQEWITTGSVTRYLVWRSFAAGTSPREWPDAVDPAKADALVLDDVVDLRDAIGSLPALRGGALPARLVLIAAGEVEGAQAVDAFRRDCAALAAAAPERPLLAVLITRGLTFR